MLPAMTIIAICLAAPFVLSLVVFLAMIALEPGIADLRDINRKGIERRAQPRD